MLFRWRSWTGGSQAYTRFPVGATLLYVCAGAYTISPLKRGAGSGSCGLGRLWEDLYLLTPPILGGGGWMEDYCLFWLK